MKKTIILLAMFCLCFQAVAVLAATPDFSGEWVLDVSKSKLPDTMAVESMTLKVSQTDKELKVESVSKMNQNQAAGGGMRRGNGGAQTVTYNLEGKEMLVNTEGRMAGEEKRKAAVTADGKLNLNVIRNFKSEMGEMTMKTNEIWELLDAGKTLKVIRYMETPRGATNAEMYFTNKNPVVQKPIAETSQNSMNNVPTMNDMGGVPKKISGGVLNGKALVLGKPEYPAAARAVSASGAVNVQVTINEQGNVVAASAVSGHPLLRQAAEQAARSSQFAPTMLSGVPVQVTGVLVYNFVP